MFKEVNNKIINFNLVTKIEKLYNENIQTYRIRIFMINEKCEEIYFNSEEDAEKYFSDLLTELNQSY